MFLKWLNIFQFLRLINLKVHFWLPVFCVCSRSFVESPSRWHHWQDEWPSRAGIFSRYVEWVPCLLFIYVCVSLCVCLSVCSSWYLCSRVSWGAVVCSPPSRKGNYFELSFGVVCVGFLGINMVFCLPRHCLDFQDFLQSFSVKQRGRFCISSWPRFFLFLTLLQTSDYLFSYLHDKL